MRWAELGLPPVQASGYEIVVDPGLIRDQFATAEPDQRRMTKSPRFEFMAEFDLTNEQMPVAVDFLESAGHKPFWLSVMIPDGAEESYAEREVRLIERYQAERDGDGFWRMKCRMEVYLPEEQAPIQPFDWGTPVKPCNPYPKPPFSVSNLRRNDWWPRGHEHPKLLFDWYAWDYKNRFGATPQTGWPRRYSMGTGGHKVYDWWGDVYAEFPFPDYICGVTEWNDRLIVVTPRGIFATEDVENSHVYSSWRFYKGSDALYARAKPYPSVCNFHMDGTRGVAVYQDSKNMSIPLMVTVKLDHQNYTATVEYHEDHKGRCAKGYFFGIGHAKWDVLVGAEWRDDGIWLMRVGHALYSLLTALFEVKIERPDGHYYYVVDGCHGATQQVSGIVVDLRLEIAAFMTHYVVTHGVLYQISYKTDVKCRVGQDDGWVSYDASDISCFYFSDQSGAQKRASRTVSIGFAQADLKVSTCTPQAHQGWYGYHMSSLIKEPRYIADATRMWFYPTGHYELWADIKPMAFRYSYFPIERT